MPYTAGVRIAERLRPRDDANRFHLQGVLNCIQDGGTGAGFSYFDYGELLDFRDPS